MMQAHWWFEYLDQVRRLQGDALDHLGMGPRESAFRVLFERPGLRLRCYGTGAASSAPVLIVPAPIKRPYIWDLSPARSVVRRALEQKLGVFLAEWTEPATGADSPGLADYAGAMLDACLAAIARETDAAKVTLMAHSLGGIFAALYGAYRPERVAAIVLVDVPLDFAEPRGVFGRLLETRAGIQSVLPRSARVPGSLLSTIAADAAPGTFYAARLLDYLASAGSFERMRTHLQVERWTLDELPMSRELFDDLVERLYRRNDFMRGTFMLGEKALHPGKITAPLLSVLARSSPIVPCESVLAFHRAAASQEKRILVYDGDFGVALQHVGALVGDNAHRQVWPRVFQWLDGIAASGVSCARQFNRASPKRIAV